MLEKNRLEKLIKQGATIFAKNSYQIYEIAPQYFTNIQIIDDVLYCGPEIVELKNLFETKEEAEWELEFGNITRTETLSLPTWEEFFNSGKSIVFRDAYGDIQELKQYNREIYINEQYCGYLTKENYIEACKLCRKLFLGEVEE